MKLSLGVWLRGHGRHGGLTPVDPTQPGPMDVVIPGRNVFTNFSREFDLASPDVVFHLACHYTGDPVIEIAHGGEPLTIVKQEREEPHGVLSLVAIGRGLTVEAANLTITATGGQLDGGACRINEMVNVQPDMVGWSGYAAGQGKPPILTVAGTDGGIIKATYTRRFADRSHRIAIGGLNSLFNGYTLSGDPIPDDVSAATGDWVLGEGWSVVGNTLVHTGNISSVCVLKIPTPRTGSQGRRAHLSCSSGASAWIGETNSITSGIGFRGPRDGYVCTGANGSLDTFAVQAAGDVVVSDIEWFENMDPISWVFSSGPAVNGEELTFYNYLNPYWSYCMAEIMGENY